MTIEARPRPHPTLDEMTARVLNELQDRFPLVERPYRAVGERLGISEDETLGRLREARAAGVVRQVCAIYDTKSLGYSSALVAMQVPAGRLASAAAVVNAHPGVSHNYQRNHAFNMWFTVAMPPGHDLDRVIARLHDLAGAESTRPMPTLRLFKIGVTLDMAGARPTAARGAPEYSDERRANAAAHIIDDDDIAYICATQGDLPDDPEPFAAVAGRLGRSVDEVIAHGERLVASGHLRRFAAILNHRAAGFRANGMAVWAVPTERIEAFGTFVAGYRNVSHCYQRPTYEDWPYNVFSMIHAPRVDGVEEVAEAIATETGVGDRRVLYSSTEFKKIRLPYFVPEYDEWEALCEAAAAGEEPEA
ncbi:MAG: Lrp/AsnC family transcriptional regulator [Dehalococcoidia bacterium]